MAWATCQEDTVRLRGPWGQVGFSVELADTDEERSRGLMFREELHRKEGMLFVFETPSRAIFWMRNTLISLDMIFVDSSGRVRHVHQDAVPGDETPINGGDDILVVLEIKGGLARRYGIVPGSEMQHPVFSASDAVWPC